MVEEIANPERLINGSIDFSYLVMFLSPLLMIILVVLIIFTLQNYLAQLNGTIYLKNIKNYIIQI